MYYITPRKLRTIHKRLAHIGFEPVDLWESSLEYERQGQTILIEREYDPHIKADFSIDIPPLLLNPDDERYLKRQLRLRT